MESGKNSLPKKWEEGFVFGYVSDRAVETEVISTENGPVFL